MQLRVCIERLLHPGGIFQGLTHPPAACPFDSDLRRCRMDCFPYGIGYEIEGDFVLIVSVFQ